MEQANRTPDSARASRVEFVARAQCSSACSIGDADPDRWAGRERGRLHRQ